MNKLFLFVKTLLTFTVLTLPLMASASWVNLTGNDNRDIDSYITSLSMRDNSTASLNSGAMVGLGAVVRDNAALVIDGGRLTTLWAKGASNVTIESGAIHSIFAAGNTEISLSNVQGLASISVFGDSVLNIQAQEVEIFNNKITGLWGDGSSFSFNVYNFTGGFGSIPGNIVISEVPVPASLWLFSSAVMGLAVIGRRRCLGAQAA